MASPIRPNGAELNVVSLLKYVDDILEARQEAMEARFRSVGQAISAHDQTDAVRHAALEQALEVAKRVEDARFGTVNEFRALVEAVIKRNMTREEWVAEHGRVKEDIRLLREDKARLEGKASMASVLVGYVIAILAGALSLLSLFLDLMHYGVSK